MLFPTVTFLLLTGAFAQKVRFDNCRVYTLSPKNYKEANDIRTLASKFDFWKYGSSAIDPSDIMIRPDQQDDFDIFLNRSGIAYEIKNENVQRLLDMEQSLLRTGSHSMDWVAYHELDVFYNWLDELCAKYSFIKCVVGGKTYENRTIKGIHINFGKNLTGVFIEAGIHAREWVAPAATSWIVDQIVKSEPNSIFRRFNYVYFPFFNPDGYVYTWTKNRMWRKTRKPYKGINGENCVGADPNRNWDFHWNEEGTSKDPCSEIYPGPKAFSEIETKTLSDYIKSIKKPMNLDIYFTYHSYGQMLLYPWGHSAEPAPHALIWYKMANRAKKAMEAVHGTKLKVGQGSTTIYPVSGASDDWFYYTFNSTVAFTFEMRDLGKYGFVLPSNQIIPTAEEYSAALQTILTEYLTLKM